MGVSGLCFICFKEVSEGTGTGDDNLGLSQERKGARRRQVKVPVEDEVDTDSFMKFVFRYVNMEKRQDARITLCSGRCFNLMSELKKLHTLQEEIRMKMEACLETVVEFMEDKGLKRITDDFLDLELLRKNFLEKCKSERNLGRQTRKKAEVLLKNIAQPTSNKTWIGSESGHPEIKHEVELELDLDCDDAPNLSSPGGASLDFELEPPTEVEVESDPEWSPDQEKPSSSSSTRASHSRNPEAKLKQLALRQAKQKFACDVPNCNRAFTSKNLLSRHKKMCSAHLKKRIRPRGQMPPYGTVKPEGWTEVAPDFTQDPDSGHFLCNLCGKRSYSKFKNKEHHATVHNGIKYQCLRCGSAHFCSMHALRSHQNVCYGQRHTCATCGKEFKYRLSLLEHEKVTHLGGTRDYVCDICGSRFFTNSVLIRHRKDHFREKIPCPQPGCESSFKSKVNLRFHLRKVHQIGDEPLPKRKKGDPIKCEACDKFLSSRTAYRHHFKGVHENTRDVPCLDKECQKKFKTKIVMLYHFRTIHSTSEGAFLCDGPTGCGKLFRRRDLLKQHIRNVHKDKEAGKVRKKPTRKPGECNLCGKVVSSAATLKEHMNTVHSEIRDKICPHCGNAYKTEKSLQKHIQGSHSEPSFQCGGARDEEGIGCGREFRNRSCFRVHKQKYCPFKKALAGTPTGI